MALLNLTDEDLVILRKVISEVMGDRKNFPSQNQLWDLPTAPEVYVAYVPEGGIPSVDPVGTGSASAEPGWAECNIFQIVEGELQDTESTRDVYNISDSEIPQGWCLVVRDKFGQWIAVTGGGGGAGCESRNEIWHIVTIGDPTVGYIDLTVVINGVSELVRIQWDDTDGEVSTAFLGHSEIGIGDIGVIGGPLPNTIIQVSFDGALAGQSIPPPVVTFNYLGDTIGTGSGTGTGDIDGTGVAAFVLRAQAGFGGE